MAEKFKVVISGIAGRFPECDDVNTFKEKLFENDDFVTVDDRKWPVGFKHERLGRKLIPDATGKFLNIHEYDHTIFRMSKVYALSNDIVNRKVLEPSFEAIMDAGINPYSLDGSNVSVFMSTGINEFDNNFTCQNVPSYILCMIGTSKTMLSNRVSYALNLKGPSLTNHVDVHGGLESLIMGYRYVSEGVADAAIVGAASSIVDPRLSLQYFSFEMLCPDGVTRPFDEWANGYARSESVVCFYLQRAEDAKRSYGEIIFCDSCYLGSDIPNLINYGEGYLKTCMQQLLESKHNSRPDLSNIAFVEMNACGHKVLDKIESNVVAELIAKEKNKPLLVGSIKSNIGHVQAAAGLMSVLKALFVLDSGTLVPNRHLRKLNGDIEAFNTNRLQVATKKQSLPGNTVAVNSIGLSGNVGLSIIQQHEKAPVPQARSCDDQFPRVLLICGRQEKDLETKLTQIEKSPYNYEFIALANDVFRQHMPLHTYRGYTILPSPDNPINCIGDRGEPNRPVWLIFSGMGSQWNGMGKSLLKLPLFSETVAKCDKVLKQKNIDIYHILTSEDNTLFDDIVNAFVGIITVQIGLYELFKALGIKVDGIIGHSVGENACAYADGCLTLEQAVLASWARGVASNEVKTITGMMAAIGKGYAEMKDILPEGIHVACHNSADSCTLTGPAEPVKSFVEELRGNGVFAKAVNVANIAYHSEYIAAIAPCLLGRLELVIKEPKQRSTKWISTSLPESRWGTSLAQRCSAEYLTNNLLSPVLFEEGCKHIPENAICIEFAPHGLLQAILKRSLPKSCTNIPLTHRGNIEENLNFLLASIGKLYMAGLEPDVNNIFPAIEYPVPRGTPHLSPYATWYHLGEPAPYFLRSIYEEDLTIGSELIPICVRENSEFAFLKDHQVDHSIMIPPSFFIHLVWKMFLSEPSKDKLDSPTVIFEGLRTYGDIIISMQDTKYASITIQPGSGNFQVMLHDCPKELQIILTGRILLMDENIATQLPIQTSQKDRFVTKTQFYSILERAGYQLGEEFSLVKEIQCHKRKFRGEITWNGNWVTFLDALMKAQMFADNNEDVKNLVTTGVQRLEIRTPEYQSLKKGTILPYSIDTTTKELFCPGLVMSTLKYKTLFKPRAQLSSFRFVSYPNPRCQHIPEFLCLCLQIAVENLARSKLSTSFNNLTVVDVTGKYCHVIKQIINEQVSLKSTVILDSSMKYKCDDSTHTLMIVDEMEKLAEMDAPAKNLFVLVISTSLADDQKFGECFITLVQQSFSTYKFTLLKKKKQVLAWEPANKRASKINDQTTSSLVLSKNINVDDVSRLLKLKVDQQDGRYLYIMDEVVTKQKLSELMQKQIDLDIPVSVLKQGELGSYRDLIQENNLICGNETTIKYAQLISKISAGPKHINYVCFDEAEEIATNKIFGFSYAAGANTITQQIVGLAASTLTGNPEYDPYLHWTVPNNCSLEETVVMIYTYAQAYKLLVLLPSYRLNYVNSVMINVGTDYLLAEAFIVLSLYQNLEIFVTVDSDEDARLIKERFPKIPYDHIFLSKHCSYVQIKHKTCGKGIDLVVNCRSGIEHVETSLNCLAINGLYIEVGINNCQESNDMGLYPFLKLISFHISRKRVSDLLELPVETKRMMQNFIECCFKKEIITPLKFYNESMRSMKVMKCYPMEEFQSCSAPTIKYDKKHSYLILGTSIKDSTVFELIEWLMDQGACNIIVALEKFAMLSQTEYRINRILTNTNVHILFTSASKLDDRREVVSILKQTENIGPLEAIFYVAIKTAGKKISNLNDLVSPDVYFIGLSSAGLKEFEQRRAKGSPAILFYSDEGPKGVMSVLPRLNELLAQDDNNNAEMFFKVTNPTYGHNTRAVYSSLRDYLPHNMRILNTMGQEEPTEPSFTEMSSLSLRYLHCKSVYPIFALPAIHSSTLQSLFQKLMYPVFSATTTSMNSAKKLAHKLYLSLNAIQPTGPISLISETWTLPLALELVSCALRDKRKYKIFVLEGIPKVWSDRVKRLQVADPVKFDAFCAYEIFHFIKKPKKTYSSESPSFENNVRTLIEKVSCDLKIIENTVRAAKKMKRIISELSQIQFTNEIMENVIWFERCRPNDRTFQLSVNSEIVIIDEPKYRSLLRNPEVSRVINRNAEYSWWEYTLPQNCQRKTH